ncbi:NF038120 family PEP-CTERM protein [Massilia sp. MB5]|uniref:NF038120 family PEP-CTERM protein n=1 Tax=Massilia sp. MB5 TaxID=2919578 RepID=UPI001F0E6999|nr:NF038120 family PEP-CTERM protein [Massilia sp. MB5]UMR28378.1 NF038120 family PEP-CTERM protein [Massilia sp. MB5]
MKSHRSAAPRPFSRVLGAALLAGVGALAAPAAQADIINFSATQNIVSGTLNAGDSLYNGGDAFRQGSYRFDVLDGPVARAAGLNGLAGALIDGANPFSCTILACPSGNLSKYFAGLNDGALVVTRDYGAAFRLDGLDFGFIAPVGDLPDGGYGQLRLTGVAADGSQISDALDFAGQDATGKFKFSNWLASSAFAGISLRSLSIDACLFTDVGDCVNSAADPAGNQAQYALDNLQVTAVPLPATPALMLLGLAGMGLVARRKRQRA